MARRILKFPSPESSCDRGGHGDRRRFASGGVGRHLFTWLHLTPGVRRLLRRRRALRVYSSGRGDGYQPNPPDTWLAKVQSPSIISIRGTGIRSKAL